VGRKVFEVISSVFQQIFASTGLVVGVVSQPI